MIQLSLRALVPLVLLVHGSLPAQNAKDKPVTVAFVQLPEQKLPDDFTTYSVVVTGYCVSTAGHSREGLANSIVLDGFKRVGGLDGQYGHLRISVNTGYVDMGKAEAKSETRISKTKEGKEVRTNYYWYEIPFSASPSYQIVDPEGSVLGRGGSPQGKAMKSKEYTSSSSRAKEYSSQVNSLRKTFAAEVTKYITSAARQHVTNQFDFNHVKETPQFYLVTKWPTEDVYEKHFEKVKEIFESASASTPSSELREKLSPAMEFWSKDAGKDPGDDRKLKKVYYASNMNLALANFYTDDFASARTHLNNIIRSEEKDRQAENFLERLDKFEAKMKLHGITTMHYSRDLSNALPPSVVKALEEEQADLAENNYTTAGSITIKGEVMQGSFLQDKNASDLSFGEGGSTLFMVETVTELKEYDVTDPEISAFSIGDRSFQKLLFSPCAKGKTDASIHILETVYISEKIALYKYYPSTGALADDKVEWAFRKGTEPQPVSLFDTQFLLWEKGISKYFEDCADLSEMCLSGGIRMEQDDLIKAARIYSELCE